MVDDSLLVQHLLERGIIDQDSLLEGVEILKKNDLSLYETLVEHNLVDENQVVDVVAQLLNVPFVQLSGIDINPAVTNLVPPSIAQRNRVIPIQVRNEGAHRQLILGMVDPTDAMAMDEVSTHTGIDIRPVLIGPSAFRAELDRFTKISPNDSDDIFDGLDEIAVDVLDDENWADFFDSAEDMGDVEDSSVISTEMRDRPGADVFDAVDDPPSLDNLEMTELNQPVDPQSVGALADLDDWEIDDAITSNVRTKSRPLAEIVSATDASTLFDEDDPTSHADLESEGEDLEEDCIEEPSQQNLVDETEAKHEGNAAANAEAAHQTDDPDTNNLVDLEGNAGLASVSEPATREITETDLQGLTESAGRTEKETAEYKAVSRDGATQKDIAHHLDLELADDVEDRHVIVAVIKLLIEQGTVSKAELAKLAQKERNAEG